MRRGSHAFGVPSGPTWRPRSGRYPFQAGPEAGYYQVEVVVAISVLLLVVVLIAGHYHRNMLASRRSDTWYVSMQLATAQIERARQELADADTLAKRLAQVGDSAYTRRRTLVARGHAFESELEIGALPGVEGTLRIQSTMKWGGVRETTVGTAYPYGK